MAVNGLVVNVTILTGRNALIIHVCHSYYKRRPPHVNTQITGDLSTWFDGRVFQTGVQSAPAVQISEPYGEPWA